MNKRQKEWNGMNWIRQDARLAIYLRDGLACAYCGDSVENGAQLTLDHLTPHSKGGGNEPANLITSCHRCNCSRGNRPVKQFAKAVAAYLDHEVKPEDITKHIKECVSRNFKGFRTEAKRLIDQRGSAAKVLAEKQQPNN